MHGLAALLMSGLVAASGPVTRDMVHHVDATASETGEVYVAELDADWNVAKEVRLPCEVAVGCAVDLGLGDAGLAAVHVRFDAMRSGKIVVSSRLEDQSGRASAPQAATLALDSSGFGASHYDAGAAAPPAVTLGAVDGKIIMMAVRVPGWLAPGAVPGASPAAERSDPT